MNLKKVKIVSKKSIGVEPVYDINVPGVHHYILDSGVVSHNSGFVYASSILIAMRKLKLKEDEDGNKITDVKGIRAACKVMKSRYSKPFESIELKIPYESGMDPYTGLFELFEKKSLLTKSGNRYGYTANNGVEHLYFKKEWYKNKDGALDIIMNEFHDRQKQHAESEEIVEDADQLNSEVNENE